MLIQSELYGNRRAFTAFHTVGPETDLQALNLNWRESDLPQRERTKHVHGLHPYLGKFIPQLVEIFLRKYARRAVVDPFAGSGTTLVEANALGLAACGCDISYFNCLLTRVKTGKHDLELLERELRDILVRTELKAFAARARRAEPEVTGYLAEWYAPEARTELLAYLELIPEYEHREVLQVVLSRAARSARLTTHFELDFPKEPQREPYYCRKHHRVCQPTTRALPFLKRYTYDTLARLREFGGIRTGAPVEVFWGDAREVRFPAHDTVVTSPPYLGLIDYHEQHRYAYELLGLPELREKEIGRPAKGNGAQAAREYYAGIKAVFANVARSLETGGRVVIVVHDRGEMYLRMAQELGFVVEAVLERHVNRRTGRRGAEFFERVYVWRKER
ncbi:MAG: DNA methyltransferase [Desulfotomaculales bacterium]